MVLTAVLMLGIASFFRPMQTLFSTASVLDSQQTAAEGINTYICESLRYASNVSIFLNRSSEPDVFELMAFTTGIRTETGETVAVNDIYRLNIDNNTTVSFNGADYTGRINISKPLYEPDGSYSRSLSYESLGEAYYGRYSYQIDLTGTTASEIKVQTSVLNSAGTSELISKSSCKFANNFSSSGYFNVDSGGGGDNFYILYTMPH